MKIKNNKDKNRFEVVVDGYTAHLEYIPRQNHIVVFHIEVPKFLEGQGVGLELMNYTIKYARDNKLKVFPMHSMMTKFMSKNNKTHDLLLIK
jgi:hypothetical protein